MKKYKVDESICAGCGVCISACPQGVIKINEDGQAVINTEKCLGCGACLDVCNFEAIKEVKNK